MPTDETPADRHHPHDWRGDFESMRNRSRNASLAATPSQRLQWLEDAIAFATKMGALPKRDKESSPLGGSERETDAADATPGPPE